MTFTNWASKYILTNPKSIILCCSRISKIRKHFPYYRIIDLWLSMGSWGSALCLTIQNYPTWDYPFRDFWLVYILLIYRVISRDWISGLYFYRNYRFYITCLTCSWLSIIMCVSSYWRNQYIEGSRPTGVCIIERA